MVNSGQEQHSYASSTPNHQTLYYASNGNSAHLHAVSTGPISGSQSTLVSIDSTESVNTLHPMGSQTAATAAAAVANNTSGKITNQRANLFRRFPLRSILKNGKVHNSSSDENSLVVPHSITGQPRSGILKKAASETTCNGSVPTVLSNTNGNLENTLSSNLHPPVPSFPPPPILQVSPSSASSHASAKSAASLVQFTLQPERKENSVSNLISLFFSLSRMFVFVTVDLFFQLNFYL